MSHLKMTEFIYNKTKYSSTGMLFFEALYAYKFDLCVNIKNNISKEETLTIYKWVEEMRKIQKLATVPVYIYSTGINSREGQRAILLGAKDYIIKPNSINDLTSVLKEILG